MSYLKSVLQPDEEVRYVTRVHWIVYLPGALVFLLGCAALVASWQGAEMAAFWLILAAMLLVVAFVMLFSAWFKRWTTEVAVTSKRIIYKRGLIWRRTIEMNMDKVESVDVSQSVLGRIFDFGTITIRGVGTGIEPLANIETPIAFRNHVTAA